MKQKRIYIVEDARIVALELKKVLENLGYVVAGMAGSGEEAVNSALETGPDLILMDVKLGGKMSGIEASRAIRSRINVPVIYTTAYSDRDIVEEVQRSFPFGFVIKPYRQNDLLVAIETAFTRFEYEMKLEESERKYKSLFNGSGDIIVTLDDGLKVLTANWAVMTHLNMRRRTSSGRISSTCWRPPRMSSARTWSSSARSLTRFSRTGAPSASGRRLNRITTTSRSR